MQYTHRLCEGKKIPEHLSRYDVDDIDEEGKNGKEYVN